MKNASFEGEVPSSDSDNNPEVPQINIKQMTNNNSEIVKMLWPSDWSSEQWAEKKTKIYLASLSEWTFGVYNLF
ncbi:Hypothetical protein CINCED_3A016142 [Cinara cedri]|uniref:Uncharacterized protein n=1 Tax=Cinara cedri TaxID=506608 RepID=A0A5E4NJW5_9HEMI|nr:Hypothetical protein CINCED_3A016142 [Cinara cedri]